MNATIIICLFILIYTNKLFAQSEDLQINSDKLVVNQKTNHAIFTGIVTVRFNDMVLNTDYLEVVYEDKKERGKNQMQQDDPTDSTKKEIKEIVIPHRLTAKNLDNRQVVIADQGQYFYKEGKLVLSGNVKLEHQGKYINTDTLVYYRQLNKIEKE